MATKTLRLQIVTDFSGEQGLSKFGTALKDIEATLGKVSVSTKVADDGTVQYTHTVDVQTNSLKANNAALAEGLKLRSRGTKATTKQVVQDPQKDFREKERLAASFDSIALRRTQERINLSTLIAKKGLQSIEVFRETQRQKEIARTELLQKRLASIRERFAKGKISFIQQGTLRNKELATFETSINRIRGETSKANQKDLEEKQKIAKANRNIVSSQRRILNGTRSVIRANRSWTAQIARGIGLYRAVSLAITGISRAILAVPKIGIERQTTEAVFDATLGGGAGSAGAFKAISLEAERTGIAIGTLRETFRNLNASMSLAGENTATVFKVFSDINSVSTALHLSADKTSNIFLALSQIFNKTKVQSEELVKQLGNLLPGAFASFQKGNKEVFKSTQDLIKAMSQGTVFAHETVVNFTDFLKDRFSVAFALASVGLQANIGRLNTSFTLLGESIFKVAKEPMLAMVKGLTNVVNGIREATDGIGFLGTALEQLGTIAIVGITIKILSLVKSFSKVVASTTVISSGLSTITKVGISGWAILAAKSLNKLTNVFKALGGAPALVLLGASEVIGYLINLNQKAREAASGVRELISEQHRQALQGKPETITIEVEVENSEKVILLRERFEELSRQAEKTKKALNSSSGRNRGSGAAKKADTEARFLRDTARDQLERIRISEKDLLVKSRKELEEAELTAQKGKNDKLFEGALKAQKNTLAIAQEGRTQQLDILNTQHRLGLVSDSKFYKEKEALLLRSIDSEIQIAKQNQGIESSLENELAVKQLQSKRARILQNLELDKQKTSKTSKISKPKTIPTENLDKFRIELLSLQGFTKRAAIEEVQLQEKITLSKLKGAGISRKLARDNVRDITSIKIANIEVEAIEKKRIDVQKQITESQNKRTLITSQLATTEAIVTAQQNAGMLTQIEAFDRIQLAREKALETISLQIEAERALIDTTAIGSELQIKSLDEASKKVKLLYLQMIDGAKRPKTELQKVGEEVKVSLTNSLGNAFQGFIRGTQSASQAMSAFGASILDTIAKIAAQELAQQIIGLAVGAIGGTAGSFSSTPALGGSGLSSSTATSNAFFGANGSAVSGLSSVSGTVLNSATFFPSAKPIPFASGGVVAGEAGAEAVLPLKRNSQGKLGVSFSGSGGSSTSGEISIQNINVYVDKTEDQSSEEQSQEIGRAIKDQLKAVISLQIAEASRPGGQLNPTELQATF